ncbi:hypothetical protein XENOCAPTIV_015608, partial [Xenoophorus captivus]
DEAQYMCVVEIEEVQFNLTAAVEKTEDNTNIFTCSSHQVAHTPAFRSCSHSFHVADAGFWVVIHLYDCSPGQSDCSQCRAVPEEYGCVWCPGSPAPSCVYSQSCSSLPTDTCPPPQITQVLPVSGPLEGGVLVTITGSNLGTKYQDVVGGVKVADVPCVAQPEGYRISTRGGRVIKVTGRNLDVVQEPAIFVWVEPLEVQRVKRRRRLALLTAKQRLVFNGTMTTVSERCSVRSSSEITCWTPAVSPEVRVKGVWFQLDNVRVHYDSIEVPSCSSVFSSLMQ